MVLQGRILAVLVGGMTVALSMTQGASAAVVGIERVGAVSADNSANKSVTSRAPPARRS
jgi:hypothetical protein